MAETGIVDPRGLLEAAAQHIRDEEQDEGLKKATEARDLLEKAGDKDGALEALFQMSLAYCVQAPENRKEANRIIQEQLTASKEQGDRQSEAKMLLAAAWVNCDKRGIKKRQLAAEWAEEARALCNELGMKSEEAKSLLVLSNIMLKHNADPAVMVECAEEAMILLGGAVLLYRGIGDRRGEANALHWLANGQHTLGKEEALDTSAEAARLFKEVGDEIYASNEYRQLAGWHMQMSGDFKEATRCAEEALEIVRLRPRASTVREVSTLGVLCRTHVAQQDLPEAMKVANAAIERFQQMGDKKAETDTRMMMVQVHFRNSDIDDSASAQVIAEQALEGYKSLENKKEIAKVSSLAALVSFKKGDFKKARAYAESTLNMEGDMDIVDKGVAKHVLVGCNLVDRNFEEALKISKETQDMCVEEGKPVKEAITLLTICNVYYQMEDFQNAMKCAREAQALFFEEGEKGWEAEAHQAQSEIHQARQEHQAAVRAAEKAANTWRQQGEAKELAHSLVLAAQNQALLLVKRFEGQPLDEKPPTELKIGARKALQMADEAQQLARNIEDQSTLASALCAAAQAEVLDQRYNQAIDAIAEAIKIYRESGDTRLLANALVLSSRTRLVAGFPEFAPEEATEALQLFRQCNDAKGESLALQIYESIRQANLNVNAARVVPTGGGFAAAPAGGGEIVPAVASAATSMKPPALDEEMILATIQDVTRKLVGGTRDLDAEKPLMEAGVTSMTAILYRQNLSTALAGVNFPVTLVFDYPTVSAIADFVLDSGAVLGGNSVPGA